MYSLPQEIEVWYIIPTIRKELSKILTEKYKLTFEKTGEILGITKSAISQYLKSKRANVVKLPSRIRKEIEKSAKLIVENNKLAVNEIMRILALMKTTRCSCDVCKKYNKNIISQCGMKPVYSTIYSAKQK